VALALLAAAAPGLVLAAAPAGDEEETELEEVEVTGFRSSLRYSTEAKRDATGFSDSIFAEDIGKFPDTNIAESLTRIPGIQISRDVNNEGTNIGIRGLPNSFTKNIVNGVQVATASIGLNAQNQNREVDLNLFPTEFFDQLTVYKSPMASLPEGGAAGVVDMRNARPLDRPGGLITYSAEGAWNSVSDKVSPQGSLIGSWSNAARTMGVLLGVSAVQGRIAVNGFETIGWTNPGLSYTQCGLVPPVQDPPIDPDTTRPPQCNPGGGNNWLIPVTVPDEPSSIEAGLTPGDVIDAEFLEALNPGLDAVDDISRALIPRLGRPVDMAGSRDRNSVLVSFELRPDDRMHFYVDGLYSHARRNNDRIDINLVGRNFGATGMIPIDMELDGNHVVTSATMANAQFFLEARPYREKVQYLHFNPGATFQLGPDDSVELRVQGYRSRSWMHRESPTILVNTPFTTIQYSNLDGTPDWQTAIDLNDPAIGWTWEGGRVNVQNEHRHTWTTGAHADLRLGDERNNIKVGLAWDKNRRRIRGFDNSAAWQTFVLGQIADEDLPTYLRPGPLGFITADFEAFMAATNYREFRDNAPESSGANTGAATGGFREKVRAAYVELNATADVWNRPVRFNAGVRYADTDQYVAGPVTIGGVRQWQTLESGYDELLPSLSAAWDVADDIVVRMAASRTLTRPNPSSMLPNTTFTDPSAQLADQGNPNLAPYVSTNIDLGGEWYTGEEGFVGLNLFQKRVDGYTFQGTNTIPFSQLGIPFDDLTEGQQGAIMARGGPDAATVTVNQQVNADGLLKIRGVEIIWVQPLDMLLRGLGFMANFTDLELTPSGQDAAALGGNVYGISPRLWNATAYWELGGGSLRVSYNRTRGAASSGPGQNGITGAQFFGTTRDQWDLSASYTFLGLSFQPQLTLNVLNLTNNEGRTNFVYANAPYEIYNPGRSIAVGLRGTF
jgi:TonB-dependent receptor